MKLRKRGRIWWLDYHVDGVRHRCSTGCTNRDAAQTWAEQIDVARKMPTFEAAVEVLRAFYAKKPTGRTPLATTWDEYWKLAQSLGKDTIAQRTIERRHGVLGRFQRWLQKERPSLKFVEHITGQVAAAYAAQLAKAGLKAKTRQNVLGELNTIWKLLEKVSPEIHSPWSNLSPRNTDSERGKAFSRKQEALVMIAATKVGKQWAEVCTLMRQTGLRYSDVARLRWDDIRGDVLYLKPHKTAAHGITVAIPLTQQARDAVKRTPHTGDYLFPQHSELYGQRGRAAREMLSFREVLDAAGVKGPGYTIHSWRHTAATRLAESGVSTETRKRILGHTTDEMAAHYDHTQHLEEVRKALEAAAS